MTYEVPVRQVFEFPTESLVGEHCLFFMGDDVFTVVDIRHSVSDKQKAVIDQDWTVLHFAHASIHFRESPCRYMPMGSETWRGLGIRYLLSLGLVYILTFNKIYFSLALQECIRRRTEKTDCRKNVNHSCMTSIHAEI